MEKGTFSYKLIVFFSGMSGFTAYASIFGVLFACGLGVPIPEDITIISAGILAALDKISITGAFLVCFIGVMAGDSFLFFVGRKYGRAVFEWPVIRKFATPPRIAKAEARLKENARFMCFIARFLPGLRSVIFLSSGTMGVRPIVFLTQDGLAALISVPLWIWFGWFFGKNIDQLIEKAKEFHVYVIIAVAIMIIGWAAWKFRHKVFGKKTTPQS